MKPYSIPQVPGTPLLDGDTRPPRREWYRFWANLLANVGNGNGEVALTNKPNAWTQPQSFASDALAAENLILKGSTSGQTSLQTSPVAEGVITFPAETDTVVLETIAQTLENKTVASTENTLDSRQLIGTATNDDADAGKMGEVISAEVSSGSAVALTTGTSADIASIALTPGDWDVWGAVSFAPAGTATVSSLQAALSLTSATMPTPPNNGGYGALATTFTTGAAQTISAGMMRVSISASTPVYLEAEAAFGVSTMSAYGFIGARRRR